MSSRATELLFIVLSSLLMPISANAKHSPRGDERPTCLHSSGGFVSVRDLNDLLLKCSKVELTRAQVVGRWSGPPAESRASRFRCQFCTFANDVSIVSDRVDLELDFEHATFLGLMFFLDTDFVHPLIARNCDFHAEVRFDAARFHSGIDLRESIFHSGFHVTGSTFGGVADLSGGDFWSTVVFSDADFASNVHWEQSHFHELVEVSDSVFSGVLILKGSQINAPWTAEGSTFSRGMDFQFSKLGPCEDEHAVHCRNERKAQCEGSLAIKRSIMGESLLLQSVGHMGHKHRVLLLSGSSLQSVQGKRWEELGEMMGLSLSTDYGEQARQQYFQELITVLRQMERSYRVQGEGSEADQVELARRKLEAEQAGFDKVLFYWFMRVTNSYGHELVRLPAWCISWVVIFAGLLSHARRGCLARTRELWPSKRDLLGSLHLFLNFKDPEDLFKGKHNEAALLRLGRIEQMLGFTSVTIGVLIFGAYLAS